jgi:hypothetical protein
LPRLTARQMRSFPVMLVMVPWLAVATFGMLQPVLAAPVRGTVSLPAELKTARRYRGYWRIENGIVPITPTARGDTVVVLLTKGDGPAPAPRTVTVDISGLAATPPVVVVGEGSVVELKNSDRVPHDLSIPNLPSLMPLERLAPGALRRQKFLAAGGYAIRDGEYPQLIISVLVVGSSHVAFVDDKGAFKLPDAADGKATLKVWSQGDWVHEQEIEVGPRSDDLRIKVPERDKSPAAAASE